MNAEPYEMSLKRQFFTERIIKEGGYTLQELAELAYEDLKGIWIQIQAQQINIASDQNRWF